MIALLLITCLFVALLLLPEETIVATHRWLIINIQKRDLLYRGQKLYRWLDSQGGEQLAMNLSNSREGGLPDEDCYREFGYFVHELWNEVRKGGGSIKQPLRALKMLLRADLQRTRRERQALNGAYAQLALMVIMVWAYLYSFDSIVKVNPPLYFWLGCLCWQVLGGLLFFKLLSSKQRKLFLPLNDLLRALQMLNLIAFRGQLTNLQLRAPRRRLSGDYLRYYNGLEEVLETWRLKGRAQLETLDELREDLALLAEDAQLTFLPWVRGLGFMWALVFVLPLLFAGSLFGLYKLAVV